MKIVPARPSQSLRTDVVALYVDPRGPYPSLLADGYWYDEARDARTYAGPLPVVAHPPCGPWSASMRSLSREGAAARECGPRAVEQVCVWGGVLEQPSGSKLFAACGLPLPGEGAGPWGGLTYEVEQVAWGHVARKRTWLYVVGVGFLDVHRGIRTGGTPTHWCSGVHTPGARGKPPAGIKICSAQQRRRTPRAFAEWLLDLAASARRADVTREMQS